MRGRRRMNSRHSKKTFRNGARRTHRKNKINPYNTRGGIRL